jgi:hypothetical protein
MVNRLLLLAGLALFATNSIARVIDLSHATVVVRTGHVAEAEKTAASMLIEEVEKRTGIRLNTATQWPERGTAIAITTESTGTQWGRSIPKIPMRAEGYRLYVDDHAASPTVWLLGADPRGALFAAGNLLRRVDWAKGRLSVSAPLDINTSPAYPIRGHQLGYRAQANSYDAWDVAQFEQYIRELTFFGANSIESIPFQDERKTPVMRMPRRAMNRAMSEICRRYGLDYWAWIPAEFDLKDTTRRQQLLDQCKEFFTDSPELTGIFFPGGDPGNNPPDLVLPFLNDMAELLRASHPAAKIWLSLQWFSKAQVDSIYRYTDEQKPAWLGGLVAGPSSPPIPETRRRLPSQYKLRSYPDLTHNKLCQYQVPAWDQSFALTLGREAVNPRPAEFALIHNRTAPYTDGFISYSDGSHDDVNKTIWSALGWNPSASVRDILTDYARVYFDSAIAERAADGILALEKNWRGPLIDNGAVEGTLAVWQQLADQAPQLDTNWRWQMCLLRANYDAYVRRRLIHETQLENQANAFLAEALSIGAEQAMTEATRVLNEATTQPASADLRAQIGVLCEKLFHSIGLQTSVEKYYAIGEERGAVLDFVDYPLNNRWWLEDQFKIIRGMSSEQERAARLVRLGKWEHPGEGSFYDDIGNIAKSPHVVRYNVETAPESARIPEPTFWWWDQGKSRARLSWQITMWPVAVVYNGLDPHATYVVRSTGYGQALLRINGERLAPSIDGKQMGEFKEFPVDSKFLKDRKLVLTWDRPTGEEHLNWRQHSRLAEVWLIKK